MRKTAAALMAAVASLVAVARGEVLCLCDEDPDDCGHACHECGVPVPDGVADADACLHLEIASPDVVAADDGDILPTVVGGSVTAIPIAMAPRLAPVVIPRETSPPPRLPVYCSYSIRLFPRS